MRRDARTLDDVLKTIREKFPGLTPQFRLGARFLVDHPDEVAVSSMRIVASRAGVQPATMVRLAKSLGFAGWPALRQIFIDRLRGAPDPFSRRARDLVWRGDSNALFTETFHTIAASLAATRADDETVRAVVQDLHQASVIYIAGFRSCFAPAFSFYYACRLFRNSVVLLEGTGGTFEAELRALTRKDVVVVIGFAPYSRELKLVADMARSTGAKIIAVTDSAVSPLSRDASHSLLFSTDSRSFLPSVVAASALLETIAAMLIARAGKSAVGRVRAAEAQLFKLGAYLQPREHRR